MHVLGCKLKRVFVARNDDFRWHGRCEPDGEIDARTMITVLFAGPAADLHFHGRELDPCGKDHRDAISAAEKIAADESGDMFAILDFGRARAEELVRRHADTIATLSRALLAAPWHEMPGRDVEDILRRAGVQRGGSVRAPSRERYLERHNGYDVAVERPTSGRAPFDVLYRCDGWIGGG